MLKILGEKIRDERKVLGVTSQNLAEITGLSRMTLYRIENGEPTVKIGAYINVLDALNLNLIAEKENANARTIGSSTIPSRINLLDYPQLKSISWHIPNAEHISPAKAFNLYERNKRHVEEEKLSEKERDLIAALKIAFEEQG